MHAQTVLPRWRGFNLPSKTLDREESDFQLIAELGFNFVRIPTSYHLWTEPGDRFVIKEDKVAISTTGYSRRSKGGKNSPSPHKSRLSRENDPFVDKHATSRSFRRRRR